MSNESVQQELNQLREDVNRLRSDVADLVRALGAAGKHEAETALDAARQRLRQAAEAVGSARQCTEQTVAAVEQQVRKYPLVSLSAAFAVGCWCGKVLCRSK